MSAHTLNKNKKIKQTKTQSCFYSYQSYQSAMAWGYKKWERGAILMDTFAISPVQFVWQLWKMQEVWCTSTLYQSLPFNWQSMKWQSRPFGGTLCLQGRDALKTPPHASNDGWDFSSDVQTLHLSFWMFCIIISWELERCLDVHYSEHSEHLPTKELMTQ